jgi:coenzyme F420-0:L-glutamate ligase/coenzyme F420-1:gamma-L-glutamate ligase
MGRTTNIELIALPGMPLVAPGDDLVGLLSGAIVLSGLSPCDGDVLVIAQKIVSKAEGRIVELAKVRPSKAAEELAGRVGKDPRLVEVILSESSRIVRAERGVLIVEHRLGLVMANAGVDQSNVGAEEAGLALMLPADPDASAERIKAGLGQRFRARLGIVINDSFGRPWRRGTAGVAIGAAGIASLRDRRGDGDLFGRPLKATVIALADEIAAAASLLMGQADEGLPAVLLRGLAMTGAAMPAAALVRAADEDLFR